MLAFNVTIPNLMVARPFAVSIVAIPLTKSYTQQT